MARHRRLPEKPPNRKVTGTFVRDDGTTFKQVFGYDVAAADPAGLLTIPSSRRRLDIRCEAGSDAAVIYTAKDRNMFLMCRGNKIENQPGLILRPTYFAGCLVDRTDPGNPRAHIPLDDLGNEVQWSGEWPAPCGCGHVVSLIAADLWKAIPKRGSAVLRLPHRAPTGP